MLYRKIEGARRVRDPNGPDRAGRRGLRATGCSRRSARDDWAAEAAEPFESLGALLDALCDEGRFARDYRGRARQARFVRHEADGAFDDAPLGGERAVPVAVRAVSRAGDRLVLPLLRRLQHIRRRRVARDLKWVYSDPRFGDIDITINLSKPEGPEGDCGGENDEGLGLPACMLCKENIGYAGRMNFQRARTTARCRSRSMGRTGISSIPPSTTTALHRFLRRAHADADRRARSKALRFRRAVPALLPRLERRSADRRRVDPHTTTIRAAATRSRWRRRISRSTARSAALRMWRQAS